MKSALKIAVGILVFVVVLAFVVPGLLINSVVKKGIETVGSKAAKVEVKLGRVNISFLSGNGRISGLFIGNPEGYKTPSAIKADSVSLAIDPGSLFKDKVIVKSVSIDSPEITFEGGLSGNNLKKILENIEESVGSDKTADKSASSSKTIQVDDLQVTGAKLNLSTGIMGGKSISASLPDIHLRNLGKGPEGITGSELARNVMKEIVGGAASVAARELGRIGKDAVGAAKDAGKAVIRGAGDALQSVGDLLKKQ